MSDTKPQREHASLPKYDSRWAIKYPEHIQTSKIEADGGKWIQLNDGRIVEYFISGSQQQQQRSSSDADSDPDPDPDEAATVVIDCHGGNCTGQFFSSFSDWVNVCSESSLNLKVISLSQPGFGYSTIQPERKLCDWPKTDLLPVLQKENVKEFIVTGISFGTPHALATALEFTKSSPRSNNDDDDDDDDDNGIRCIGVGLRVPYMGSETCIKLDLKNHLQLGYTSKSANTTMMGNWLSRFVTTLSSNPGSALDAPSCLMRTFVNCLNPGSLEKIEKLKTEYPEMVPILRKGFDRSVVHSTQGILYNYATETLIDHGFDVQDIPKDLPMLVWYATDDEDCPPSHGEWLTSGKYFTNVSKKAWTGYGHIGTAFVEHTLFLEELKKIVVS